MTTSSGGSQPNSKGFLDGFVKGRSLVAEEAQKIEQLKKERIGAPGDEAFGKIPAGTKAMFNSGVIKI